MKRNKTRLLNNPKITAAASRAVDCSSVTGWDELSLSHMVFFLAFHNYRQQYTTREITQEYLCVGVFMAHIYRSTRWILTTACAPDHQFMGREIGMRAANFSERRTDIIAPAGKSTIFCR